MAATISAGEDGALDGLPRLLRLFVKHKIPVSFYIPAVAAMMHPEMIAEINKRKHHEVAIHGWIHENPMTLDDPVEEWRLISQAMDLLEKQWGRRPVGNRNPSWTMSTHTIGLLKRPGCSTTAACRRWTSRTKYCSTASRPDSSSSR